MRRKLLATLIPALLVGATFLATPAPVMAAGEVVETGATTYTVNVAENRIDVSVQLRIKNNKPPDAYYVYYWDKTRIAVEAQAGPVKATSNAGAVSQSVASSNRWYRYINLGFPKVWYGQTRVISINYSIDGAPRAKGDYRAVKAYTNLCAIGSGYDAGSVKVILPDSFDINFYSGGQLQDAGSAGGLRTLDSGNLTQPYKFWSCLDGSNPDALVTTKLTVAGHEFAIQSWPEDPSWKTQMERLLEKDIEALQAMNGLDLPRGLITVREVGNSELGEYAGLYNSLSKIAYVTEQSGPDIVAHELSHIWYNRTLFEDKWASEGLAGYSEQLAGTGNYDRCVEPGKYPGTGKPDLGEWMLLDLDSTLVDEQILEYQYAASCYIITKLAQDMGEENLKAVLSAAGAGEMAYQGATPNEKFIDSSIPLSAEAYLDLIDELGMVPAGVKDLDQAQQLLAGYGLFSTTDLADRSSARAAYHELADKAGEWKLPLAVRGPMSSWDFDAAEAALTDAAKVIAARDEIEAKLSGFSFAGTVFQRKFQGVETAEDLTALTETAQKQIDAAAVLADARAAESGGRNPLQMIGLLGTDLQPGLNQATDALKDVRPDEAKTAAQNVIDQMNGATMAGVLRLVVLLGLIVLAFLAFMLVKRLRNRRRLALATAAAGGEATAEAAGETTSEATAETTSEATAQPPSDPPAPPSA